MKEKDQALLERQLALEHLRQKKTVWEGILASREVRTHEEILLFLEMMDNALADIALSEEGWLTTETVEAILPWRKRMEKILLEKKAKNIKLIDAYLMDAVFTYTTKIVGW